MAAPYTLADLLSAQGPDQLRAKFLAILGADPNPPPAPANSNHGFPTADWLSNPAGMEMAFVNMVRSGFYDLITSKMGQQIASGWLARASGDWLTFHASLFYQVERNPPTKTVFKLKLSSAGTARPYDFSVGDVWVTGRSGHRYVSTTAGHLDAGGELVLSFEAEFPGAASNDDPTIVRPTLVTAFAGVSVSAAVAAFSDIYHQGDGTGHLELSRVNEALPADPGTYTFRVDIAGDPATAYFSVSLDGTHFSTLGPLPAATQILSNVVVKAVTGSGSPASFLAGDLYLVTAPGGTSYVQGNDEEGDTSIRERCRARWPSIALNQTSAVFKLWAKTAVPSVSRVSVRADPLVPGRVQIVAADSHGGVDPVTLTAIAAYINPRLGSVLDSISVSPAVNRNIVTIGAIYVTALTVGAIQQAVADGWSAYLATVDIGGAVILAELIQLIMDAGATDVAINFTESDDDIFLGPDEIPVAVNIVKEVSWIFV